MRAYSPYMMNLIPQTADELFNVVLHSHTPYILMAVLNGKHSNRDICRACPLLDESLGSKYCRYLVDVGLLESHSENRNTHYELSPAGRDMAQCLVAIKSVAWIHTGIPKIASEAAKKNQEETA